MLTTTHGEIDETRLARTVIFEDRPNEFVVAVEWRMPCLTACEVCMNPNNPQRDASSVVLVRRDAWVNLKQSSVEARAVASAIGG